MRSRLAAAALLTLLPTLSAKNAPERKPFDGPQWRGPNRDAVCKETGLLQQWPANGPPVVWKRTGLGGGFSAPAVAAGRIFGMGNQGNDEVVWALEESTGRPLWTRR